MSTGHRSNDTAGRDVFIVGAGRSGGSLLYKLLCLHPEVAYVSNLERRLPWLTAAATGRLRLRRYSSKLRHWFHVQERRRGNERPLMDRVVPVPVEAEVMCRGRGGRRGAAEGQLDARTVARMRAGFSQLKQASGSSVLVSRLGAASQRLPVIDAVFPQARYLRIVRDGRDVAASLARLEVWNQRPLWWDPEQRSPAERVAQGDDLLRLCARHWLAETASISRGLARIPEDRVHTVRFETLVAEPIEQMREVLYFLGLERRRDYEWALKALRLGHRPGAWHARWENAELDRAILEQSDELIAATPAAREQVSSGYPS